ncbi:hypothetical protein F4824DRAFT_447842 [Ustulina deusta]|nr:hypothetical protein F4824DRAFT_447842 [Ustulina deusta]
MNSIRINLKPFISNMPSFTLRFTSESSIRSVSAMMRCSSSSRTMPSVAAIQELISWQVAPTFRRQSHCSCNAVVVLSGISELVW